MSMFCHQCQEAARNVGCSGKAGVCGKSARVANLHDLLIYALKGVAEFNLQARKHGLNKAETDEQMFDGMFSTITNANFDPEAIKDRIDRAVFTRDEIKKTLENQGKLEDKQYKDFASWEANRKDYEDESTKKHVGILRDDNEDIRSLRSLVLFGLKGICAYGEHAYTLGKHKPELNEFIEKALLATSDDSLGADELTNLVLETGSHGVDVMSLLDEANTSAYGNPEITEVDLGVRSNPGILVSGHDLRDFEELLEQSKDQGVDIYTHSEMLPAQYYPAFKKYDHFAGNYGNSWWKQKEEFETFNGPVLFTTNCIVPPKESYTDRIYTTGAAGYPGFKHIPNREEGGEKNFSEIIKHAKRLSSPTEIEQGKLVGGFAHNQVMQLADKVVDAVNSGAIKQFFVMAGCDGRMKNREYYTDFAKALPEDTVILTAGCAKYRYNKLDLGDIGGIPRVLDAGQCNDSYSLAVIALKLKEVFELEDINDLPISFNIAWYEQKAVIVLLALLSLGVKNIKLGPTLPAFLSENVANVLVEKFGINGVQTIEEDMEQFLG
jgi:hydroxylamine reductase